VIAHETGLTHRTRKRGSARAFGLAFAAVFGVFALFPIVRHREPRAWLLAAAVVLALISVIVPRILDAPNRLWLAIGERLSLVTSTILVTAIYFVVIAPMGIFARIRRKDALKLGFVRKSSSYWIARDRPDLTPESLTRQF
jgi:cell division protein FtsW (lipid II flippase)